MTGIDHRLQSPQKILITMSINTLQEREVKIMYKLLIENYKKHVAEYHEKTIHFIKYGYTPSRRPEIIEVNDNGIKRYSTKTRWDQYQAGTITREQAVKYAIKRYEKRTEKEITDTIENLKNTVELQKPSIISIYVEYKRNYTWGYNPSVTVYNDSDNKYTYGYASGCGYDKTSAAIAQALNASPAIKKLLYLLKEKGLQEGKSDYSHSSITNVDNRNIIAYGAGYDAIPYFEGGCGVSCIQNILKLAGYKASFQEDKKHTLITFTPEG